MSIISSRHIFKWRVSKTKSVYLADVDSYEPFIFEKGDGENIKYTLSDTETLYDFPVISSTTTGGVDEEAIIENIKDIGVMDFNIAFKKMQKLLSYDSDGMKMVLNDYFSYYNVYDNVSMPTEKEKVVFPLNVIVRSYGPSGATIYSQDDRDVLDITGERGEDGYTVYLTNPMLYPSRKGTMTNSGNTFYTDVIVFKGSENVSNEVVVDQSKLEHGKKWGKCDNVRVVNSADTINPKRIRLNPYSGTCEEELTRHYGYVDIPVKHNDFETTVRWNYEIVELLLSSGTSIYQTYSSITQGFRDLSGNSSDFVIEADGISLAMSNSATSASTQISLSASGMMISMQEGWNSIDILDKADEQFVSFTNDLSGARNAYSSSIEDGYASFETKMGSVETEGLETASSITKTFMNTVSSSVTQIERSYNGFSFVVSESGETLANFIQSASTFSGDFFDGPIVRNVVLTVVDKNDTYKYKKARISNEKNPQQGGYEIIIQDAQEKNVTKTALSGLLKYKIGETSLENLSKINAAKPFAITVYGTNDWSIKSTSEGKCYFCFPDTAVTENTGLSISFCMVNNLKKDLGFTVDVYDAHSALTEYGHFVLGCNAIDMLHTNISGYCSEIEVSANTIERRVSDLSGNTSTLLQSANTITSRVSELNEQLSSLTESIININADTNYFGAAKITFDGYTSINGGVIIDKEGKMTLNDVEFDGVMGDDVYRLDGNVSGDPKEYSVHDYTSIYCPVSSKNQKSKVYLPCEPSYNGRTITVVNDSIDSFGTSGTTEIVAGRTLGQNVFASIFAEQNSGYTLNQDNASENYCIFNSSEGDFNIPYNNIIDFSKDNTTTALNVGLSLCESLGYDGYKKGDPLKVYGEEEGDVDINWQFGNVYENEDPLRGLAEEINISNESVDLTGVLSNRYGLLPKYQFEINNDGTPYIYHNKNNNVKVILPVLRKIENNDVQVILPGLRKIENND